MNQSLWNTDYAWGWLFVAFIVAAGIAFLYYFKEKRFKGVANRWIFVMAALRFSALFILFFLLLGISFKQTTDIEEKPVVVVIQDQSSSVINGKDSNQFKSQYINTLKRLGKQIEAQYDVAYYNFDAALTDGLAEKIDGKSTDIANVFYEIRKKYANRNLGAIVLASDGNYNKGNNPAVAVDNLNYIPVFTIGMGDTIKKKDTRIADEVHNDVAFFKNSFPVKVFLESEKIEENKTVNFSCFHNGKKVHTSQVEWSADNSFVTIDFELEAESLGIQEYQIVLDTLENEWNTDNNKRIFYVEVLDARQKILITSAGPHPDIATIYQSLIKKKGYEIEVVTGNKKAKERIAAYDLVIIHNPQQRSIDIEAIKSANALWVIATQQSDFDLLNQSNLGFTMRNTRGGDNIFPAIQANFSSFQVAEEMQQLARKLPPLMSPYGKVNVSPSANILAKQRLGSIIKDDPLWFLSTIDNRKVGVLLGEGLWRWRNYNQLYASSTKEVEDLIGQWAQLLALKTNKSKFRIQVDATYSDQEAITLFSEVFNDAFELTTNAEVKVDIKGKDFDRSFTMIPFGNRFKSDLGLLPPGEYEWKANAVIDGKKNEKSGSFVVKETYLESQQYQANHQLLRNIAASTNGEFVSFENAESIADIIINRGDVTTVVHQKFSWKNLLDDWWWLLIAAVLLFVEWFMRKRLGTI